MVMPASVPKCGLLRGQVLHRLHIHNLDLPQRSGAPAAASLHVHNHGALRRDTTGSSLPKPVRTELLNQTVGRARRADTPNLLLRDGVRIPRGSPFSTARTRHQRHEKQTEQTKACECFESRNGTHDFSLLLMEASECSSLFVQRRAYCWETQMQYALEPPGNHTLKFRLHLFPRLPSMLLQIDARVVHEGDAFAAQSLLHDVGGFEVAFPR